MDRAEIEELTMLRGIFLFVVCLGAAEVVFSAEPVVEPGEPLAERLFQTAMKFELERDNAYRNRTLRAALEADSNFAKARWHSGEVASGDGWVCVRAKVSDDDPVLLEYAERRQLAFDDPRRELDLAKWCRSQDLEDRERLHLMRVVYHPSSELAVREIAAKRLGMVQFDGQWLTKEQLTAWKEHTAEIERGLKEWTPRVAKWKKALVSGSRRKRDKALTELEQVRDPAAILALETELSLVGEPLALIAVRTLSNIEHHDATASLVRHALGASWPTVVEAAAKQLKDRPMHEYVPALLSNLDTPTLMASGPVYVSPRGLVATQRQIVFKEGLGSNRLGIIHSIHSDNIKLTVTHGQGSFLEAIDPSRNVDKAKAERDAIRSAARAKRDIENVEKDNLRIEVENFKTIKVLKYATGRNLGPSAVDWWDWWHDYNEVSSDRYDEHGYEYPKPTYVSTRFEGSPIPVVCRSCFAAGTPVWTDTGIRSIETILVGDRVLAKDPDSGELDFVIVTEHTVRPPSDVMQIKVGDESIVCTKGHPFWINGAGWKMAKLIEKDDAVHGLEGAHSVTGVKFFTKKESAHNLVVDGVGTYLVGNQGLLVHDNTYRAPTRAVIPGYVQKELLEEDVGRTN